MSCKQQIDSLAFEHICPLEVRLLTYPERVPNPWGFFYAYLPVSQVVRYTTGR